MKKTQFASRSAFALMLFLLGQLALAPSASAMDKEAASRKAYESLVQKGKLDPQLYDIWAGKKDRIYLAGAWKIKKLEGTKYAFDNQYESHGTLEIKNKPGKPIIDQGTKDGYWRPNYNDTKWSAMRQGLRIELSTEVLT
jgi:hypothetical protein